jgi:hypothetical protein
MPRSRFFALLLALSSLALPASSLAQSAGDDQYQDPIAGDGGYSNGGGTTNDGTGGGTTGGGTTGGGGVGTSGSSPTTTAGQPTSTTTASGTVEGTPAAPGELPRTGGDPVFVALFGVAMLLMGTSLTLTVPRRR